MINSKPASKCLDLREDITAFVLAGGKSSRMGQDKALLKYKGVCLVEHAINVLCQVTGNIRIIGDPQKYSFLGYAVIPDRSESRGPLTGIYTALSASKTRLNIVLACDMPLIRAEFFSLLLKKASQADAVVMRFEDGFVEPLCSIYASTCLSAVKENLEQQQFKVSDLFSQLDVKFVSEAEIRRVGLDRRIFVNINTPDEFKGLSSRNPC
jgi:molybdopterin-guanine dinucleotide biosynthesis protein A